MYHSKGCTALIRKPIDSMQTKNLQLIHLVLEPLTRNNRINGFKHSRDKLLLYHKSDKNPRSCIAVTEGMHLTFMPHLSDPDSTTIHVNTFINDQDEFLLCSIYLGHDSIEPENMIQTKY